ncbi:MAG: hypothetical protein KC613_13090, partial [Myxococcales bacterium]|nr:hypothetical protein [Myxococcales bacterium]
MRAAALWESLKPWLTHDGEPVDALWRWGRLALLVGLALYTPGLVLDDMRSGAVMQRWIYRVCFVLHEAGHPIFGLFGPFLGALGGTLMQLLMPAAFVGDFLRRRHPFGAAVCLWWLGASLITVAPYVADARLLVLPLHG